MYVWPSSPPPGGSVQAVAGDRTRPGPRYGVVMASSIGPACTGMPALGDVQLTAQAGDLGLLSGGTPDLGASRLPG